MKIWSILFAFCQVNNLTLNPWYYCVLGLFSLFCLFLFCTNFGALPVKILVNVIYLTDASIIWQQGLRFVHLLFTVCSQESFRLNFVHVLFTFCSFYVLKNPRQYFDRGLVGYWDIICWYIFCFSSCVRLGYNKLIAWLKSKHLEYPLL